MHKFLERWYRLKVTWERVDGLGGIQTAVKEGETFYSLLDTLDAIGLKPSWKNGTEKQPVRLSGRIVCGLRFVDGNYIESVFIDKECLDGLIRPSSS